jgi:hypothetical protein
MWPARLTGWRAAANHQRLAAQPSLSSSSSSEEEEEKKEINNAPVLPPSLSRIPPSLPTQQPLHGKLFVWERTILRYTWQVNLVTRQRATPERDERQLLPEMVPPEFACAIIATALHELRVQRSISCNGPSAADVRNWFKQRANVDTWDKPYHPRHYEKYVRREAMDLSLPPATANDDSVARLSFLNLLTSAKPLNSPQDILRLDDLNYFLTRTHELMSEARRTGQVRGNMCRALASGASLRSLR